MGFWLRTSGFDFDRRGIEFGRFVAVTSAVHGDIFVVARTVRGHIDSVDIMHEYGWLSSKPVYFRIVCSELCGIEREDGNPFQIMMLTSHEEEDYHNETRQIHGPRNDRGIHLEKRRVVRRCG